MGKRHKIPGLPKWPRLQIDESTGTCIVFAKHLTYGRLNLACFLEKLLVGCLVAGVAYLAFVYLPERPGRENNLLGAIVVFSLFLIVLGLTCNFLPIPRIIARLFFPCKTRIVFHGNVIEVSGRRFEVMPDVSVQFRASRPHLNEDKYLRLQRKVHSRNAPRCGAYKLEFRRVEMIYGSCVEHLATVANQGRAEQFALVLQAAFTKSRQIASSRPMSKSSVTPPSSEKRPVFDDNLPE